MGIRRMCEVLTELEGIWREEVSNVPPVALRYTRTQLGPRLGGAALKECLTLASGLDLMLMGRQAEAADVLMQRLKSLERISMGAAWQATEKLELTPGSSAQISSHQELAAGGREERASPGRSSEAKSSPSRPGTAGGAVG